MPDWNQTLNNTDNRSDNTVTIGAIAILAAIFANVGHHVIGHALACVAAGGHILVLTAFLFHCTVASRMIDAGAALMNFLLAALMWSAFRSHRRSRPEVRLFFLLSFAFNLFWGSGQMVYSAALNKDDWAFALRGLVPDGIWRPVLVLVGCLLYFVAVRVLLRELTSFGKADTLLAELRKRRILLVAYGATGVLLCAAAVLYHPDPLGSMREVALETFAINFGFLLTLRQKCSAKQNLAPAATISFDARWIGAAIFVYVVFAVTLCRGL